MVEYVNEKIRAKLFSGLNGYTKLPDVCVKEGISEELANAFCDCIYYLKNECFRLRSLGDIYNIIQKKVWVDLLFLRVENFDSNYDILTQYILHDNGIWYKKFDVLAYILQILYSMGANNVNLKKVADGFANSISKSFEKFNYGYRVIDGMIAPITSEEEKKEIERAIAENADGVRTHLQQALVLLSQRPNPDYRNSIKESITAVEFLLRKETGQGDIEAALKIFKKKGSFVPEKLRVAIDKLYGYTNDKKEGIRHALMDDDHGGPGEAEARYMLITCSALINYIRCKKAEQCL